MWPTNVKEQKLIREGAYLSKDIYAYGEGYL